LHSDIEISFWLHFPILSLFASILAAAHAIEKHRGIRPLNGSARKSPCLCGGSARLSVSGRGEEKRKETAHRSEVIGVN
jgi:hypothetical protein